MKKNFISQKIYKHHWQHPNNHIQFSLLKE